MKEFKTQQDLADELAAATQMLPEQCDNDQDQRGGEHSVDFTNPVSLQAAICQASPFGDLVRFDGIVKACAEGKGQELLRLVTPSALPEFDTISIKEIVPTVEFIQSYTDLQLRAEAICRTHFFATCVASRALIEEVADAGPLGALAQAYLHPPVKPTRRRAERRRPSTRGRR